MLLFDLQVNLAGAPCPLDPLLPLDVEGPEPDPLQVGPLPLCHKVENTLKKKYVDDLTLLESIDLQSSLVVSAQVFGPPNLHEQPGLCLPHEQSVLQHQLDDLLTFTEQNKMKLNMKKTKVMPFNFSKKFDFLPQLQFLNQEPLEVIYQTRLLGVTLSSDLSWAPHTNDITIRAAKKLWVLIRFKSLGATTDQLLTVFQLRIRSTLEFAAPVFHSGLTQDQSRQIEMVQKKAFAIILGKKYYSYESALKTLEQEKLETRREKLSLNFAEKCTKSSKFQSMFPLNTNLRQNMRHKKKFKEFKCKTNRYYNSSIPYLTRLLNKKHTTT